jgi:PhnB protein
VYNAWIGLNHLSNGKAMQLEPYLFFDGRSDEAIEFYKTVLGAKLEFLMRFNQCPPPHPPNLAPELANKVMHATLRIGESNVMVSDGPCKGAPSFSGFSLSVKAANAAEARRIFPLLGDGEKVTMPLDKTFFASLFGMVTDRFGVSWMLIVEH